MTNLNVNRRDLLKGAGVGILSLAGLSAGSMPAAAHEKIDRPATDLLGPIQVPANSDAGFNYPYYLYLPETTQEEPPMLVEPNNSGFPSDDLKEHRSVVKERLADGLGPQLYSKALMVPLLVPVFPRPAGDIAPIGTYTHALDEDSLEIEGTDIDRVDLQLVNMIEHAQKILEDLSYPVADDVLMNGFSASGNFVNRFAALHPNKVRSLSAGGINGTPILPLERAKGHELDYPIGIADIEEVTGDPFDLTRWRSVSQFLYLGGEDDNDTIPYDDAWSERHQQVAVDVYGEDMQEDRMPYSESVYNEADANATFRLYDGVGHTPVPIQIQRDIADFHRRHGKLKQLLFVENPEVGDTTLQFNTFVFDNRDLQIRVRSTNRGDITEAPGSITNNAEDTSEVSLSSAVEEDEEIVGVALPTGSTAPDDAVASVGSAVKRLPMVRVVRSPTGSQPRITIEYGVESDYQTSSPIHLYIEDSSEDRSFLTTFEPGTLETQAFNLMDDEFDVAVEEGTELSVLLVDIDDDSTLSSTSIMVGQSDGDTGTSSGIASVAFSTQPSTARDSLDITYSIEDGYEPTDVLSLQGEIGEDSTVLLGGLAAEEETTETFSLERIPTTAGSNIIVKAVDGQVLATDKTVVLRDTDGAVTVEYTDSPTSDDPSATVEYSVSESYEVVDTLTLRVYDETLYGGDAVDAIELLSPGDAGTATFTIGKDIDGGVADPIVAVVDDVPLARATTDTIVDEQESTEETENDQADESTDANGPGFDVGSGLVSLSVLSYALRNRLNNTSSEQPLSDDGDGDL